MVDPAKRLRNKVLYFDAPHQVSVRNEEVPRLRRDSVLVRTLFSGISAGTEMLFYRGQVPTDIDVDESIPSLTGKLKYPLKYGYCAVGEVVEVGGEVSPAWKGRTVFALHPHQSYFPISPEELTVLPEDLSLEDTVFLPNMDTAVNLIMDARPVIGEKAVIFGQGAVGLLTTALLAHFPLTKLITLDSYPLRRERSLALGAHTSLDPGMPDLYEQLQELLEVQGTHGGADLTFELSGNPPALDQAIAATAFAGRVIIGSWYGRKQVELDLGGRFHRNRVRLISSQVSTIAPEWTGRWDKKRRLQVALRMIERVKPASLITHRFPIDKAAEAYKLLDQKPKETLQVVLTYDN